MRAADSKPATSDGHDDVQDSPLLGRNVVWGLSAGACSMVVHLALLLVLGLMVISAPTTEDMHTIEAALPVKKEKPPQAMPARLQQEIKPSRELAAANTARSASASAGVRGAVGATTIARPQVQSTVAHRTSSSNIEVGPQKTLSLSGSMLNSPVPTGAGGDPLAAVVDYTEAMDRITQEILNKLAKGKVLVVWVFDQSESMQDDRREINLRIKRVYDELGLSKASGGDALLTAVTSFGASYTSHTPQPTSDVDKIMAAIDRVPVDPTGQEQMCMAISTAIAQHQKFVQQGGRQMLCILVSDESGDHASNVADLERTIQTANDVRCPIYVLGREAVFGYPYAHMRWTDPETKLEFWLRIDRGPETPYAEQLQVDGIHRRFDAHPSGFGPYEQTRLAQRTGGVFFLLPSPEVNLVRRDTRVYDADAMRPYLPDLSERGDYAAERDKHPLRATIARVIADLNPYDKRLENVVQVRFWDWPIERDRFAREADANIKKARVLIEYYAQAQQALETAAKHRDREPSLRWRANYDLTYAQTIAYQARLYEYVDYIGKFKVNPKPIKNELGPGRPTNAWDGTYVQRTLVDDPRVAALRERALELYRRVVADHPGTPWSARAEYEIDRGFGIELREDYEDPRRASVKVREL